MNKRIWVPEDLSEIYCDKVYQGFTDEMKGGLVAFDRVKGEQKATSKKKSREQP